MPQQRSKKLSESRQAGDQLESEARHYEDQNESDEESLSMLEKDSDEEELDRLVLGDGAGFKAQLGMGMEWEKGNGSGDDDGAPEDTSEADVGLEGVDDRDVNTSPSLEITEANYDEAFFP
jgi:U3 small nucleolar RNA-associated protein 18